MTPTLAIAAAGRTHIGRVRRRNEDVLYVGRHLAAIADGMGGHVAGDIASSIVMGAIRPVDRDVRPGELASVLARAVRSANDALRRRISADPAVAGMGSTLVALLWSAGTAALAHIGDSRAYLRRNGQVAQLTEDHTYQHLVAGADRVPTLPERLVRYLDGRAVGRSPDVTLHKMLPGDRYLLCSDGLSSYVPHRDIHGALASDANADEASGRLVALALDNGGPDNVTVVVVDVRSEDSYRD